MAASTAKQQKETNNDPMEKKNDSSTSAEGLLMQTSGQLCEFLFYCIMDICSQKCLRL